MKVNRLFRIMNSIPRAGIYALVNHSKKRVYIGRSKDVCLSLSRLLLELQDKTHTSRKLIKDRNKLEFLFLEEIHYQDTLIDVSIKYNYWVNEYRNNGYEFYVKSYNFPQFRVRIDVGLDYKVYVKLLNKGYKELVVGVFDTYPEAEEFAEVFNNMSYVSPVYAINNTSKEYFRLQSR